MTEDKLSLLHVADWEFAPIPNRNAVVFRMHYVEGTTEQPHKDRKYVLTAVQAEALRDALDAVLRELETQQERSVKESAPN
jgi:23S rRNA maturation mini-RNase III